MSKIDAELVAEGVSEIKYYYKNLPIIGNVFTACLLLSEDNKILARGVSICSVLDYHNKKNGREKSRKRAVSALFKKVNSMTISENDPASKRAIESRLEKADVKRLFKIEDKKIEKQLISDAKSLELNYDILTSCNKLRVYIPYFFPIDEAKKYFDYKSEYLPKPTEDEKKICRM